MSKKGIEKVIGKTLKNQAQKNALDFVRFLREKEIPLAESDNYWEVKYRDKCICFIWIDGSDNKPGPWTIWSNGDYDNFLVDDHIKELAWANINPCGSCGEACSPGNSKTVFGKKFENICNSAMAFTNPDSAAIECVKKHVEIKINES